MPELPEVETICRFLLTKLQGRKIIDVKVNQANLRAPVTEDINKILKDNTITNIKRRGKYIILYTDSDMLVVIHLGMSGKLIYGSSEKPLIKHDHVVFFLDNNDVVIYNDPRRFGMIVAIDGYKEEPFFQLLGIEPLTNEFNGDTLKELIKNKKTNIKSVLMNNKVIVGIGNIYAAESLFFARISPLRSAKDLNQEECDKLVVAIKNTLTEAIHAGGSTLKDYFQPFGSPGYFQHHFKVYNRAGKPCLICQNTILSVRQSGRSAFYCNICQL